MIGFGGIKRHRQADMRRARVMALPAFALLLLAVGTSCNPCNPWEPCIRYHDVSYVNETDEPLSIEASPVGRDERHLVMPGEAVNIPFGLYDSRGDDRWNDKDDSITIHIYDERGCLALAIPMTLRKIQDEHDSKIVVTTADIAPPGERSGCDSDRSPTRPST